QIYLMANAHSGRHYAEIIKRFLCPFQKSIALFVAFVFLLHILLIGVLRRKIINLYAVVYYQINWNQRIYFSSIASFSCHFRTKGSNINNGGNSCKILHQNACGLKGDVVIDLFWLPI